MCRDCPPRIWEDDLLQTHLGGSTGYYTIHDLHRCRPGPRPGMITALPKEVILSIFEEVLSQSPDDYWDRCPRVRMKSALTLVDRRFNHIAIPILYRDISLQGNGESNKYNKLRRLHWALQTNKYLRQHIRTLKMNIGEYSVEQWHDSYFSMAQDLCSWASSTVILDVHGGFRSYKTETWALIDTAASNMPLLKELSLSRSSYGFTLRQLVQHVAHFNALETLSLHGVGRVDSRVSELISPEQQRTASFTRLRLSDYGEDSITTSQLLSWPRELRHMEMGSYYNNENHMDLGMFGTMLSPHKHTLEVLKMGYLSRIVGEEKIIDVSEFSALTELELSRWSFTNISLQFSDDVGHKLLAPRLAKFTWSFSIYDQHSETITDMGDREEEWLRQFATFAARHNSALKGIYIEYRPPSISRYQDIRALVYPWDRLDRVKRDVEKYGIKLGYNEPSTTKQEWSDEVENQKRRARGEASPERASSPEDSEDESASGDSEPDFHEGTYLNVEGGDIRQYFTSTPSSEDAGGEGIGGIAH